MIRCVELISFLLFFLVEYKDKYNLFNLQIYFRLTQTLLWTWGWNSTPTDVYCTNHNSIQVNALPTMLSSLRMFRIHYVDKSGRPFL